MECFYGEDEYRCDPSHTYQLGYREAKKRFQSLVLRLQNYPLTRQVLQTNPVIVDGKASPLDRTMKPKLHASRNFNAQSVYETIRDSLPNGTITFEEHYIPFICNRGVAVKYYTGDTVCFCPPSFYGPQCEFYSDRITIGTHLDLTNYRRSFDQIAVIKVLTTFLFEDQIIDYYEFHVNPRIQTDSNYVKQGIYFLYPRMEKFIQMKKVNRSGIQVYSVRFEAFNLYMNETIEPIGVWQYPIYFDFLPAFHLSKILRFNPPIASFHNSPCLNNSCGRNGVCQEVINSNRSSYFCSCNSAYYGIHCEHYDEECNHYCSPRSICKPKHSGILTGNHKPLCLCSASTFGGTCYLKHDNCHRNPCLHGGSCIVNYDLANTDKYTCLCTDFFTGDHCQFPKGMVDIKFKWSSNSMVQPADIVATTVSYSDYHQTSLNLNVRHQQVYDGLPSDLKLKYSDKLVASAPTIAVLKVYGPNYHSVEPEYYILYFYPGQKNIDITVDLTSENHCPLVQTLWHLVQENSIPDHSPNSTFNSSTAVFSYHRICQAKLNKNPSFTCFRDLNYLCICEPDHYRAECFGYNRSTDQCSVCLSNEYCLKGELNDKTDFRCFNSHYYNGTVSQQSTHSFTSETLLTSDMTLPLLGSGATFSPLPFFSFSALFILCHA